jgi:subtilisin-like proprotein convertase family protein
MLKSVLDQAVGENIQAAAASSSEISLPMPDGSNARFRFVESPVMAPELAAKFPELKTYVGQGIDDPQASVRFDRTPEGLHAQILSPNGAVYIDPQFRGDTELYASYYKRDYRALAQEFQCFTPTAPARKTSAGAVMTTQMAVSGANLRTFRLACAATGEYTQFQGGTLAKGMSAILTAINRVTGVYESELAIRLTLVANNNLIVYTNPATDPYNNSDAVSLLMQNQSNLDYTIGSSNYDIGHVFSTGGGGLAGVGVVCVDGIKAQGETGSSSPVGDAFYIDYVAHEMGHQFGANHSFNSTIGSCGGGSRVPETAYEPGSGSTIMAYAGICGGDDLQAHSDPYFHSGSVDEIQAYLAAPGGGGCAVVSATGNQAPVVSAGPNYVIPKGTPFNLTAAGSDPDGDAITYCWEERDLGPATSLGAADNGSSPLFRSWSPTSSPTRTFPKLVNIISNTPSPSEILPTTGRTLAFRVTARDNRAGGGGVATSDMTVTVASNAGPFVVTAPAASVTWSGSQTVTWNVAGTVGAPINESSVNILLSTNGGLSFPITLATNVSNTGTQLVALPGVFSTACRVRVEAADNVFFAISPTNFTIVPPAPALALDSVALVAESCGTPNQVVDPGETVVVNFALRNVGNADTTNLTVTLLATNGVVTPSGPQTYGAILAGGAAVSRSFSFTANGNCGGNAGAVLRLQDGNVNRGSITQNFTLGTLHAGTRTFTNSGNIKVPATNTFGVASPYPAGIVVSGVTGTVSKVTVTLAGVTHPWPGDLNALLVGPAGQTALLMSHPASSNALNNATFTFDDAAATAIPANTAIVSGNSYRLARYGAALTFAAPAPAAAYGTALSAFNGVNPNGTWSLYIQDDGVNDTGNITRGWTLAISTSDWSCCTGPNNVNHAPTLSPIPDFSVNEQTLLTFTNQASDVDVPANQLTYSLSNAPAGANIDPVTGVFTWTPSEAQGRSTNFVAVIVTDNGQPPLSASRSFTVTVNELNQAPVLPAQTNFTTTGQAPVIVTNTATDMDMPINTLAYALLAGPTNASIDANGVISWNPDASQVPSTNTFTTVVTDFNPWAANAQHLSATNSFVVVVLAPAAAASLIPVADRTIHAGSLLSVTISATVTGPSGQSLAFTLDPGAPAGATINPTNGLLTWATSDVDAYTTNTLTVRVTDYAPSASSDTKSFTVTVLPRPAFDSITKTNDVVTLNWSAIPGQTYRVQYSDVIAGTNWSDLSPDVTASGSTAITTDSPGLAPQRFYRITLNPMVSNSNSRTRLPVVQKPQAQ